MSEQLAARNFVIYGVSRGLGKALVESIPRPHDQVYGIARTAPRLKRPIQWIAADLAHAQTSVLQVKQQIQNQTIDVLIYNVGIWEHNAFSSDYDFEHLQADEIQMMLQTNINACILHIQALLENLRHSSNAKIILIGSTWGVDNHNGHELVFSACKYALRGIAQSLREILRRDAIAVTVLNLGYLASTDQPMTDHAASAEHDIAPDQDDHHQQALIPLQDVIHAVNFILATSSYSCVKEILMPAMQDRNV
ncbi:SDR family NAD(P)-dependent oxidoreductase [Acinetobacter larvae]|uniref:Short-chain dehydrogenase n=1 Tax=Acinetobacter larvae TaxID=1789224 RepID=A0A1B2M1I8_9GAMM|nr:SDR family oxidoreductase [Acinetobacter larvae]AOA59066.1 short-chain dehydrogenase [Acinetobacter larvae]